MRGKWGFSGMFEVVLLFLHNFWTGRLCRTVAPRGLPCLHPSPPRPRCMKAELEPCFPLPSPFSLSLPLHFSFFLPCWARHGDSKKPLPLSQIHRSNHAVLRFLGPTAAPTSPGWPPRFSSPQALTGSPSSVVVRRHRSSSPPVPPAAAARLLLAAAS